MRERTPLCKRAGGEDCNEGGRGFWDRRKHVVLAFPTSGWDSMRAGKKVLPVPPIPGLACLFSLLSDNVRERKFERLELATCHYQLIKIKFTTSMFFVLLLAGVVYLPPTIGSLLLLPLVKASPMRTRHSICPRSGSNSFVDRIQESAIQTYHPNIRPYLFRVRSTQNNTITYQIFDE